MDARGHYHCGLTAIPVDVISAVCYILLPPRGWPACNCPCAARDSAPSGWNEVFVCAKSVSFVRACCAWRVSFYWRECDDQCPGGVRPADRGPRPVPPGHEGHGAHSAALHRPEGEVGTSYCSIMRGVPASAARSRPRTQAGRRRATRPGSPSGCCR